MRRNEALIALLGAALTATSTSGGTMLPCSSLGAAVCGSGACPVGETCLPTGDDVVACGCFAASTTTTVVVTTTTVTIGTLPPPLPPGSCECDPSAPPNFDRTIRTALDGEAHAILYRGIGTSPSGKNLGKIAKGFQKIGTLLRKARSAAMLGQLQEPFAERQQLKAAKLLGKAGASAAKVGDEIATAAAAGAIDPTAAGTLLGLHAVLVGDIGGISVSGDCFDHLQPNCSSGSCPVGSCLPFGTVLGACLCQQ